MAQERRTRRYRTEGNVAYQPEPARPSRRDPRREQTHRAPERRVQPREQRYTRPRVEVRRQAAVSPFTIVGLAAALAFALLLVMGSVRLSILNDQTVDLRNELADLQEDERGLQAQYEMAFDLNAIEEQLTSSGAMVKARPGQVVYLDLSGGDSVMYYDGADQGLSGMVQRAEQFLRNILS